MTDDMATLDLSAPATPPAALVLLNLISGAGTAQAVGVMAQLGIADQLGPGACSVAELSGALSAHAPTLRRLLRALVDAGLLVQVGNDGFGLSEAGHLLRSDAPGSVRGFAAMVGSAFHRMAWTNLYHSVKTGESAFESAHGVPLFEYLETHPADHAVFDQAMTVSIVPYRECVTSYNFGQFRTIVDVGGGRGQILAEILSAYPTVRGILFDRPSVVAAAPDFLATNGVAERCQIEAGSFFDYVPGGGDAYLLANIVHDWDDASAVRILRSCRQAMAGGARLVLIEGVQNEESGAGLSRLADLELLVIGEGGRLRGRSDYVSLFRAAGFALREFAYSGLAAAVITAAPV